MKIILSTEVYFEVMKFNSPFGQKVMKFLVLCIFRDIMVTSAFLEYFGSLNCLDNIKFNDARVLRNEQTQ